MERLFLYSLYFIISTLFSTGLIAMNDDLELAQAMSLSLSEHESKERKLKEDTDLVLVLSLLDNEEKIKIHEEEILRLHSGFVGMTDKLINLCALSVEKNNYDIYSPLLS